VSRIAVIGAGAWGTALSIVLAREGRHQVRLWAYEREVCDSIRSRRTNDLFLPDHTIPESVDVATELAAALNSADIVLAVMP
jgi:glycerol-3-phosphate dehydrogenase (NAD(P)+)